MNTSNSHDELYDEGERMSSTSPGCSKTTSGNDSSSLQSPVKLAASSPTIPRNHRKPEPIRPALYVYREPSSDSFQQQLPRQQQLDGACLQSDPKKKPRKKFGFLSKIIFRCKNPFTRQSNQICPQETSVASSSFGSHPRSILSEVSNNISPHGSHFVKLRSKAKDVKDFEHIIHAQTLSMDENDDDTCERNTKIDEHSSFQTSRRSSEGHANAVWAMKFSNDGKYLAAAGKGCIIKIWCVVGGARRQDSIHKDIEGEAPLPLERTGINVFDEMPVQVLAGHTSDILDLSWSKTHFLLSSSMDNRVMLWHASMKECLCVFQHTDFVTSVTFHPMDDRIFLSGSVDGKVRTWDVPDKRCTSCSTLPDKEMATAVGFADDGKITCAGSFEGRLFLYQTEELKYISKITIKKENSKKSQKITAVQPMPGSTENVLVTSNDSHIRLIDITKGCLVHHYKGADNEASQIRASFSDDGRYVICGSDKSTVHIWCAGTPNPSNYQPLDVEESNTSLGLPGVIRRMSGSSLEDRTGDRRLSTLFKDVDKQLKDLVPNHDWYFPAHDDTVTCAIFAPRGTRQWLALTGNDTIYNFTPVSYAHCDNQRDASADSNIDIRISQCVPRISGEGRDKQEELLGRAQYDYSEGHIIVTGSESGQIKVWRVDSGVYGHHRNKQEVSPE